MSEEPTRSVFGLSKRTLLLGAFIISVGAILYSALLRLHYLVKASLGSELAVVAIAGVTIGVMFLILLGMGLGGVLEWTVCKRFLSCKRKPLALDSKIELLFKMWGIKPAPAEVQSTEEEPDDLPSGITMQDVEELLMVAEQRRYGGKKSQYTDEVQFRAVRDWMIMQSHGTSVTLQQFLEERFGVAPETGMPLVPNQTFYSWRKKFLKELTEHKQAQSKKKLPNQ